MNEFTTELQQVFDVAPSRETGLVMDTFDGASFAGDALGSWTRGDANHAFSCSSGATRFSICGVAVPA